MPSCRKAGTRLGVFRFAHTVGEIIAKFPAVSLAAGFAMILWMSPAVALDIREMRRDGICKAIVLNGGIAFDEATRFIPRMIAAAEQCGSRTIVVQHMMGGSANDAIRIGEAIRAREYVTATLSDSVCASACGLMYLAGVQRYWNPGARFLIHRPEIRRAIPFKSVAEEEQTYGEIKSALIGYVAAMGGNPDYVELMYAVSKDGPGPSQRALNLADMLRLGLATHNGAPF